MLLLLAGVAASSQEPQDKEKEKYTVVVTGTYAAAPVEDVNRNVDVIDIRKQRELFGSFADVLKNDSSLDLRQRGPNDIQGDLSIRGVTKPVVLDVTLGGATVGQGGQPITGWTAETTINRKDYGLEWNRLTEAGGWVVGDDVRIVLEVEARGKS